MMLYRLAQHDVFGVLIVAETKKDGMPQSPVLGPFRVSNLGNEFWR